MKTKWLWLSAVLAVLTILVSTTRARELPSSADWVSEDRIGAGWETDTPPTPGGHNNLIDRELERAPASFPRDHTGRRCKLGKQQLPDPTHCETPVPRAEQPRSDSQPSSLPGDEASDTGAPPPMTATTLTGYPASPSSNDTAQQPYTAPEGPAPTPRPVQPLQQEEQGYPAEPTPPPNEQEEAVRPEDVSPAPEEVPAAVERGIRAPTPTVILLPAAVRTPQVAAPLEHGTRTDFVDRLMEGLITLILLGVAAVVGFMGWIHLHR